jgi:hypothetical protein
MQPAMTGKKEEAMKILIRMALAVALLVAGFAVGFPVGKSAGFTTGGEWALVQAGILARESGLFMPVSFEKGRFRVVIKQPRNFYKRAWRLADRREDATQGADLLSRPSLETVQLARNARLMQ